MVIKGVFVTAILALAIHSVHVAAVKDDAYIAYLNGTNVAALGLTTLDGVTVTQAPKGSGFLTLTDFGKNVTGWTLDKLEALPSPATLKLFYYNATNKASPPKLLDLTSNFTDYSPFGEFTIATLNTALSAIGVAPVSGASPLISLVKGNNLLGAWISTTGAATVGLITDDPNVGPPPDVIEEDSYLTEINSTPGVFASATLANANGTLSVINNGDGTYSYEFFSQFATGPFNRTIIFPESLSLVAASSFGYPTPVVNFRFTGRDWIRAASDIGTEGTFTAIDLQKGLKRARATPGSSVPLYAQLSVSDINGNYLNYGTFDPAFDVVVDAAPVVVPSPSPSPKPSKSPKPSPKPAPKPAPKPKRI